MTTNRSCFTRIIGHKSLTVHRICTKFDARIRLCTAVLYIKLQYDRSMRLQFIAIFASVQKHEEKEEKPKLWLLVTQKWLERLISFKFGMLTPLAGGKLCCKFGSNRIGYHRVTKV